jgi:hypothetical protein
MLRDRGLTVPSCLHLATHFSPNGTPPHEETDAVLAPHGVRAAYDGLTIDI